MATTTGYTILHVDDFDRPWPKWSLARKSLGLSSFGMNVCHLEPGEQIPEHDEAERDHEEVFITLDGAPSMVVDGEAHPLPRGAFARVDPDRRRTVRNDGEATAMVLIVSAPRSSGYEPLEWA
jgi:quercetin dioxygenase-like cupin family protein